MGDQLWLPQSEVIVALGKIRMAKRKVQLTEDQQRKNQMILAQIEAEKMRLFEETRALQQQFRRNVRRKRSAHGQMRIEERYED